MALFARQVWTLCKKDLVLAAARRPISTSIRALVLPLAIVLIVSYAQYFFNPPQHFGIGKPHSVLDLSDAISRSSGGRNNIAFVHNGMIGGDISGVIEDVVAPIRKAGMSVSYLTNEFDLLDFCPSSQKGTTSCFGAVIFHSSPSEPVKGGTWNYTIRSDTSLGSTFDVGSPNNDAQIYLMPLQRAIDMAIIARMPASKQAAFQEVMQYPYTDESEQKRQTDTRMSYFSAGVAYFGVVFFLGMIGVVYQMTGSIANERERGLTQLIDAMMPNTHRWEPQLARLFAHYAAFSIIYLPSWLAIGIILASVVFVKTAAIITICYHLTVGFALCSYTLAGSALFKKAQLSGIIMIVVTMVLAVIPQVLSPQKQTATTVLALSLLFPSSNYTYFITYMARWEYQNLPTNLSKTAPKSPWELQGLLLWIFLIIQILAYPVLALLIEHMLFDTISQNRTVTSCSNASGPTVRLRRFSKSYRRTWFFRFFWKRKAAVDAVKELSLEAHMGQILMLLGPNGSGKSSTLDAIAGLSKTSSGHIDISGNGGLGITPQKNVLWDDLTVEEHVTFMYNLKAKHTRTAVDDVATLIEGCDLTSKLDSKSKTLSGGQKRKLQLAMMFAGGSSVCCVDEVSSGLDPLSRRKIWDILLAQRRERTIIMTTHFLDEADFLSDYIAILSTGHLQAEGSSAGLKHKYGEGYSIHTPAGKAAPYVQGTERKESSSGTKYTTLDSVNVTRTVDALELAGIKDFRISGPTLEDVFLKIAGRPLDVDTSPGSLDISATQEKPKNGDVDPVQPSTPGVNLHNGENISPWHQVWVLYLKRWMVFRRNYFPILVAMALALIGAGVCPILLQYFEGMHCSVQADNAYTPLYGSYTDSLAQDYQISLIGGPSARITDKSLAGIADIYSSNRTVYGTGSINGVASLKGFITSVDTYEDFREQIQLRNATVSPGGFWLGDASSKPTFAWSAKSYKFSNGLEVQNVLHNLLIDGRIATSFSNFDIPPSPILYDFAALLFIIYYSLVLCLYPAFYALYPTLERLRNVRALQYSNAVKPLSLWLTHILFDLGFTLVISIVSTVLLSIGTRLWYHLPYLFLILLLYGISSSILSYIVSMLARSPLAAWALCASGQVVFCLGYFGAYIGVQSNVPIGDLTSTLDKIHFTIGLVSPVANVMRSLFVALNQFTLVCGDASIPGDIELYGGPILYLVLQIFVFLGILLWWDSGVSPMSLVFKKEGSNPAFDMEGASASAGSQDLTNEIKRVEQSSNGLRVLHLTKSFRKMKAVDDVTFGVEQGEVFALLGPNGAGKSTAISLIRGDIPPSSPSSSILVNDCSLLTHRTKTRAHLGVCPQFDATDLLTVTQHLRFYAQIRGVASPIHNVEQVIRAFGLDPYRHRLAHKLSGGTKRKLSLAIALIGNPSVLLLDEPSSGLDAGAKRDVWDALKAVGKDRSIVLTTHSMEEADALAHRAGIMSSRMLAVGTVDGLRKIWGGDAYHVRLVMKSAPYTTAEETDNVISWIKASLPGAEVEEETYCGQIRFSVPANRSMGGIGRVFRLLEGNREGLGVEYFSLGETTMDEVFVNIVRRNGGREEMEGGSEQRNIRRPWWRRRRIMV